LFALIAAVLCSSMFAMPDYAASPAVQGPSVSAAAGAAHAAKPARTVHSLEAADLESWLDGMMPATLEQGDVAGAVVSVVKDGQVLLAKGYGYADKVERTPMDAGRTLVRPGSVSKLFTWTAVMQLVEQGKIDLDADVNTYLDFRIPAPFGHPITMNDLMTHRAGFEEGLKDAIVTNPADLMPLGAYLKGHVRPVLFAPGKVPAYSNYGTALAGYIVERVSGEKYDDYVTRHIFAPLQMERSTFVQPLPGAMQGSMSSGYMSAVQPPRPFELISFSPAGALTSTATDMAHFMIAHLQQGRFEGGHILAPRTTALMHTASRNAAPGFDVMAHGFFRDRRNGRVILEHGGDTILFHSSLELLPDDHVGIFVSFNSRGAGDAVYGMRERLLAGFLDRYFPAPVPVTPPPLATAMAHAREIAGRYETSRRVETGFMSLFYVLQGQSTIDANPDGTISISSIPDTRFREVAVHLWQAVGGTRMVKVENVDDVRTVIDSENPVGVLTPAPLARDATVNLTIFALSMLLLVAGAIAWIIAEGARRVHRQPPALTGRALLARRLARIATVADLVYLGAWFAVLKPILGNEVSFYTAALDLVIHTLEVAAIVPILGAVAGVWNAWLSICSPRPWIIKTGSVAIALALVGFVWIAAIGGWIGFTVNY
jgi:CubicO group peptidase (beta-lactamase class C family)